MEADVRTIALGNATVSVINIGDLRAQLDQLVRVPEQQRPPRHAAAFAQTMRLPIQCVHIAMPGASLLVDAPVYEISPDSPYFLPDYQPPPDLLACLATIGESPASITHVAITHAHFDHYNGATLRDDGRLNPTFPQARHYLGRADWEHAGAALADPESLQSRTLAVLQRQGLLEFVEGDADLGHGIRLRAAPGESPGHQIVRVQSAGQTLYCLGDLFHHTLEVEQPSWMSEWADAAAMRASRLALIEAALAEDALLIATHIRGVGRLRHADDGVQWEGADL